MPYYLTVYADNLYIKRSESDCLIISGAPFVFRRGERKNDEGWAKNKSAVKACQSKANAGARAGAERGRPLTAAPQKRARLLHQTGVVSNFETVMFDLNTTALQKPENEPSIVLPEIYVFWPRFP